MIIGLECMQDSFEIQKDSIQPNDKVLLVDDLLATGGNKELFTRSSHGDKALTLNIFISFL